MFGASAAVRQLTGALCFFVLIPGAVILLNAICVIFPFLWPLYGVYIAYIMWDDTETRPNERACSKWRNHFVWNCLREYYPVSTHALEKLDDDKTYLFCSHPHGIFGQGIVSSFALQSKEFRDTFGMSGDKVRVTTLPLNFKVPFWREVVTKMGFVSVDRKSFDAHLSHGTSLVVVVGGASEALDACPTTNCVHLKHRKGFVRRALHNGVSLVPVFTFGENELFNVHNFPEGSIGRRVQTFLKQHMSFSMPLFFGRFLGMLPFKRPLTVVTGRPLELPHLPSPTPLQVDEWHTRYVERLRETFAEGVKLHPGSVPPLEIK
ncbi:MAG: hypothetical protein MHM6MM_002660 [Cercozoa sp. M6MM]